MLHNEIKNSNKKSKRYKKLQEKEICDKVKLSLKGSKKAKQNWSGESLNWECNTFGMGI